MGTKKEQTQSDRYAAALSYELSQDEAPRITATGRGELADSIKKLAETNNIPVYEDADLAKTLYKLGINTQIPPELYEVVAQILAYVALLDQKKIFDPK